jgi:TusA-related sulfurtransferase
MPAQSPTFRQGGARISMHENRPAHWEFEDEFDGGEETCGRVIINLYTYLKQVAPGTKVLLISRDAAAPIEFPAWCRMTGNTLLEQAHPYYLIEYKPELKGV